MRLGDVLRNRREAKGLTQAQLARRAKITDEYVSMLETGAKRNPSLAVLQRLAKVLGVSVSELLANKGNRRADRDGSGGSIGKDEPKGG
jgi:XRE family transcriptional regulator of biofilm formation